MSELRQALVPAGHEPLELLPTRLPRGFALGDYMVDAWVHDGSTAAIHRAHHITDGRCAAIKVQLWSTVHDPVVGARFEREAEVLWWVRGSAHAVELLDLGILDDGRRYLVTQWLDGESLETRLDFLHDQDQRLTVVRACRLARELALGLVALHERGVVHLDLQPAHVMVRCVEDGVDEVTLVGFGHAADLRGVLIDVARDPSLLAIPAYLAPERAQGGSPSPACDIYALGVMLFEMVAGACLPADGWSLETLPHVDALRHGVPPALAELVRACMSREIEQRPASARMVVVALDAIVGALEAGTSNRHGRASALSPQALRTGDTLVGMVVPPPPSRTEVDPDDTEVAMRLDPVLADPFADPDDTAVTMVLEPAANEAPTRVAPALGEASTSSLERLAQEEPWWLRWAVAAAVLLLLGGTGAWWLLQRSEGVYEAKATSAVTASSIATSAVEARAPAASSPAASSDGDEQGSTTPQRDAVARAKAVVAVQQAPDAPADDSPEVDERVRAGAASKATCEDARARADAAKRKREWGSVLAATRRWGCWSSAERRVARARLRVTALAELGKLERCVAVGSKSRDRAVAALTAQCQNELAARGGDAVVDEDGAPIGADVAAGG